MSEKHILKRTKSPTTHEICEPCFEYFYPLVYPPCRLVGDCRKQEPCCYCGDLNLSGIYIREESRKVLCQGMTGIHKSN